MKTLNYLLVFISAVIGFNTQAQTSVIISPERPVSCDLEEGHAYVNWIYNLKKISEDQDQVSIQFTTMYGSCANSQVFPKALQAKSAMIGLLQDKIVLFQRSPYKATISDLSATELQINIKFDKKRIFKKENSRIYYMNFFPGEMFQTIFSPNDRYGMMSSAMMFPWKILIEQRDVGSEVSVRLL